MRRTSEGGRLGGAAQLDDGLPLGVEDVHVRRTMVARVDLHLEAVSPENGRHGESKPFVMG
jgi:hypothetical protein